MGFFQKINKIWSGADFWDKKENQQQRQDFAQVDEEERRRRQEEAARNSVSQQQAPDTAAPGEIIAPEEKTPKPGLIQLGDLSANNIYDPNQPLQKLSVAPVQQPTLQPVQPKPAPPNAAELRQRAIDYRTPKVQDVNDYYGSDVKVLEGELAKGEATDWGRVEGLMRSLDNRSKELEEFHRQRGENDSFKGARELEQLVKDTRGDWTRQDEELRRFWNRVSEGEKDDFQAYLVEAGKLDPREAGLIRSADWRTGTQMRSGWDFKDEIENITTVQDRQQIADAAMEYAGVGLDQLDNRTISGELEKFRNASPEEQRGQLAELEMILEETGNNASGNQDLQRKADQAYLVYNVLLDSGAQKDNFHTRMNKVGDVVTGFGKALLESPRRVTQSIDALVNQEMLGKDDKGTVLYNKWKAGELSDEEYNKQSAEFSRSLEWLPEDDDLKSRFLVSAGTSADTVATFLPIGSVAKGAKGAFVLNKLVAQGTAKGLSKEAAELAARETLKELAKGGSKMTLKKLAAQEAVANALFSGVGSLREGEFDAGKTVQETLVGGAIGYGAPYVGAGATKGLQKLRGAERAVPEALEDVGRVTSRLEGGVDDLGRISNLTADEATRVAELRAIIDDVEIPAYQRVPAREELAQIEAGAVDRQVQELGVGEAPTDRPAYQHKQDLQDAIDEGQAKLDDFLNDNPNASLRDIEIARAAINAEVMSRVEALQSARYAGVSDLNIPDPATGRTLAKVGDELEPTAPIANFGESSIQAPLRKVEPTTPAPAKVADAPAVDATGNPALVTDATRARQLAEEGVVPTQGESPTALVEDEMARSAARTADEQGGRVTAYKDPTTGENVVLSPESVVDEITALQAIPAAKRTVAQEKKLRELLDIYRNWDERSVAGAAPSTEELFPNMSPAGRQGVDETLDQLEKAQAAGGALKKVRSEEKGARIAKANAAYEEAGGGVAGMRAKTRALAGEYSKSGYDPIQVSENVKTEVLDDINASTGLRDWEKFNTQRAFEKMWGVVDEAPTAADIRNIRRYYNSKQEGLGDTIAEQLRDVSKGANDAKLIEQIAGAPRTAMTTFDLSAPRQGGVLMARHPIEGTKAFINGVINAFKPKRFKKSVDEMANAVDQNGVNYADFMQSVMDVHLPSVIEASEEVMSSTPLLSKIPGYGRLVKGSDRAFSGTLSELRFNVTKNWIDNAGGIDAVMQNFSEKELRDLGEAMNTLSGRGGKAGGFVDKHASILSKTLFSGRLWASRLNMLNPYWYYRLSGPARKEALSSAAAFAAMSGTVLYMAEKAGAEVGWDPRSADFAKIKIGNTRYDILGGLQQNIRVASQILTGTKINSVTGEETDATIADAVGPFAEGKLSPLLGFAWRMAKSAPSDDQNPLTREDQYGNEINVGTEALKLGAPMGVTNTIETVQQDNAGIGNAIKKNLAGFFGAGVQTYGGKADVPTKTSDIEQAAKDGDYDKAIAGYRAQIEKENKRKEPSSGKIKELEGKITKLEREADEVPDTEEAVKARVERGEFGAAIAGYKQLLSDSEAEGSDASPDKQKDIKDNIKRLEITLNNGYGADVVKDYEDISLTEWRDMIDPDDEAYDPERAGLLLAYDEALAEAGVSRGKSGDKTKYSQKKSGSGRGGRGGSGSKAKIVTDIGMISPSADFAPLKAQGATFGAPQSAIPQLEKVPNYNRKLKKISVSRGRR